MTLNDYTKDLLGLPVMSSWSETPTNKKAAANKAIIRALDKICASHPFPFALGEKTEQTNATDSSYTLQGNDSECQSIEWVKYDGARFRLPKRTEAERDIFLQGRISDQVSVNFWTPTGVVGGHPTITFYGPPGGVKDFLYKYRRMGISASEFPMNFADDLLTVAVWMLFKSSQTSALHGQAVFRAMNPISLKDDAKEAINNIIDDYAKRSGGSQQPPIGQAWRNMNRRRDKRFGFG